jgi:ribosome-associated heat shock protein Hsp15
LSTVTRRSDAADIAAELRIDRWLWCTRFFKTRSSAAEAVRSGHVRINGARVKPAHAVKPGDLVEVTNDGGEHEVGVIGIPARRGPGAEARLCYTETAASAERRRLRAEARAALAPPPTEGRPDKRTRRLLLRARARR